MKDPNDTRNIGPRIGSPLWIYLTVVTTGRPAGAGGGAAAPEWPGRAGPPSIALAGRRADRGRRDASDRDSRQVKYRGAGRVADFQLRRAALLGVRGRRGAAGNRHAGGRAGPAQGSAPVGVQRRAGHPEHGGRRAGAGRDRDPSDAGPALEPGWARQLPEVALAALRLFRGELPAGQCRDRAALARPDHRDAARRAALPGVREPGTAQRRAAGGGGDGSQVGVACAAVRFPARGRSTPTR